MRRSLIGSGLCGCLALVLCACNAATVEPSSGRTEDNKSSALADTKEADAEGFRFPEDRGGALLRATLAPPIGRVPVAEQRTAPRRRPPSQELESPRLALMMPLVEATRLPMEGRHTAVRPRLVTEEDVFAIRVELEVPEFILFYAAEKTRLPSIDVDKPPPLQYLGQPLPDRASLADATADASSEAALSATLPRRLTTAPFLKLDVPDPFVNRHPLKVTIPDEDATPATAAAGAAKP